MIKLYFIVYLITIVSCRFNDALHHFFPSEDYPNRLDACSNLPNQYILFWKLIDNNEIQFEIHV